MRCPSLSLILSQIFLAYIAYSIYTLSLLFVAPSCEERQSCLTSYIAAKPELRLHVYSSARKHPSGESVDLIHTNDNFNYTHPSSLDLILNVTQKTQQTGKLFLHVFVLPSSKRVSKSFSEIQKDPYVSSTVIKMTQYAIPEAEAFNLLGNKKKDAAVKQENRALPVPHIRTKVTFTVMTDDVQLPVNNVPIELMSHLRIIHGRIFLPIVNYDSLQSRDRDLVRLTPKDNTINITLSYLPISLGKLRLILHIEKAILTLKSLGFSDKDVDEAKGLFTDINIYLLGGTFFIAAVHLLFDFLAFKNDVNFWRKKDNLIGLSKWTVMWRGFSQTVIFLYLLNEGSSVLVLIPAGIGSIIEIWKLKKVLKLRFHKNSNDAAEIRTREVDAEIMRYLSHLLYPLVIGGAIYSLLYQPHKSWYSWSINSLANGVYAFGFLFMLPQLFVNYKLKSVAHLPWRAFTYKAFNTFIDDVFAFIVPMPTAHRLACFRDDAVFLMYLYQRWLYPVDRSRTDIDMATGEVVDFGDSKKKD